MGRLAASTCVSVFGHLGECLGNSSPASFHLLEGIVLEGIVVLLLDDLEQVVRVTKPLGAVFTEQTSAHVD